MSAVVALVSCTSAEADRIAVAIVQARAAACANVVPAVRSVYWWNGSLEHADESLLVLKTTRAALPALEALLRDVHPYEVFELVALEVAAGAERYLAWIGAETRAGAGRSA